MPDDLDKQERERDRIIKQTELLLKKEGFRLDIDNRAYHGLLILNGGGAVALLAFLQAILGKDMSSDVRQLAGPVVIALAVLVAGVALAVLHQALRSRTSLAMQSRSKWYQTLRWCSFGAFYFAFVAFLVGMAQLLSQAWSILT